MIDDYHLSDIFSMPLMAAADIFDWWLPIDDDSNINQSDIYWHDI